MTAEFEILEARPDEAENIALAGRAAATLDRHYPGHLWGVHVDDGLMVVRNLAYRGQYGFVLHVDQIDPGLACVMRAGGELLERHSIARGRRTESTYDPMRIGLMKAAAPDA